ncbi:acetylglutamate kinase [Cardiobacteriaceae bacterium TAE3-ERU3]|nr:acetylglutamate kinase [Cardiobacteriaceae bacterium TAE3-ERU3]
MRLAVIKYGGNAIADIHALEDFAAAIAELKAQNIAPVVVHGGGPQINHWLDKTNTTSHFVNGQRFTDQAALDVVEMALCGHVNKAIVRALQRVGLNSVGISGEDANLIHATANPDLGAVGIIEHVEPALLHTLLSNGYTPVIAPLGCDNAHNVLNINADYSAAHIAAALNADDFILMTNVAGLLDADGKRIATASAEDIDTLIAQGTIYGGMLPKVDCALVALRGGCKHASIIDGTHPANLAHATTNPGTIGTLITA